LSESEESPKGRLLTRSRESGPVGAKNEKRCLTFAANEDASFGETDARKAASGGDKPALGETTVQPTCKSKKQKVAVGQQQ
jgi:hypothetical protein